MPTLTSEMTVALDNSGPFWFATVDDGLGFPAPAHVSPNYCAICARRLNDGHDGAGPCEHKRAVVNALLDELDSELPYDGSSDRRRAVLRRAIAAYEAGR